MLWLMAGCLLTPSEVEDLREALKDRDGDGHQALPWGLDCDDDDPLVNVLAEEVCDGIDNNCDGDADEGWYVDADGDGFISVSDDGECVAGRLAEESPGDDCDDGDASISPGAPPDCRGGVDLNCNGIDDAQDPYDSDLDGYADCIDDCAPDDPDLPVVVYRDADGDGYGDPESPWDDAVCEGVSGYVDNAQDCDDTNSRINPGTTWYRDQDDDGYGVTSDTVVQCPQPDGYVLDPGDCDDFDGAWYPGAPETDCTDPNDYNCDGSTGYADNDGDGHPACEECDDSDPDVNPDATEVCDTIDNDCDGQVDEDGAVDVQTWYRDSDSDGYGDLSTTDIDCDRPTGFVANSTDCDDSDGDAYPGAVEYCDSHDDDCDGTVDESGAVDALTWYNDGDSDGHGDSSGGTTQACSQPSGYAGTDDDCDDTNSSVSPSANEVCNNLTDDDCDSSTDSGCWLSGSATTQDVSVDIGADAPLAKGLAALDISDDGSGDVLAGSFVFLGPITADISPQASDQMVSGTSTSGVGDVNGDGVSDYVTHGPVSGTQLFLGPITAQTGPTWSGTAGEPVVGDFDGDGLADLHVSDTLYLGDSSPTSMSSVLVEAALECLVDVNADGQDDLVHRDGLVIYGPVTATITDFGANADVTLVNPASVDGCTATDQDGDGYDDLLLGDTSYTSSSYTPGAAYLLLGSSSLSSSPAFDARMSGYTSTFDNAEIGSAVAAGDVNQDGTEDVVVASSTTTYLFYGPVTSNTAVVLADYDFEGIQPVSVAVGDVSGDSVPDLVVSDESASIGILLGGAY